MENETQISPDAVTHELDPVLAERELASFQTVLGLPITGEQLDHWFKDGMVRRDLLSNIFSNTVWGTIRWRKSMGRPLAPTLASAFVIEHISWQSETIGITPTGEPKYTDLVVPHPEPSKWDGPGDEDYYRVSFMAETAQQQSQIRVNFAAHIAWEHRTAFVRRGYRDIDPSERLFLTGDKWYVLEPFEVIRKPYYLL
jgi:hypothetical protein